MTYQGTGTSGVPGGDHPPQRLHRREEGTGSSEDIRRVGAKCARGFWKDTPQERCWSETTEGPIWCLDRSKGPVCGSSDFLGDPPPDPRFLASLGALSWADLHHCVQLIYLVFFLDSPRQRAERSEKTGVWGRIPQEVRFGVGQVQRTCWWVLLQTPVFSLRSARCHW
jgi:hypothetical protein